MTKLCIIPFHSNTLHLLNKGIKIPFLMSLNRLSESETRYQLIDPMVEKAGWILADRRQVGFEVPVDGYDASPMNGITDYCLYMDNGEVLAVIEAKRTRRDARVGKKQLEEYLLQIEAKQSFRPFGFMTNGDAVFFWDSVQYSERQVAGFFTKEDLENLLFFQRNKLPLSSIEIKSSIVNRAYQVEAIRRISEAIEIKNKRKALLVMATGTGKTRTTMALIDIFLRAHRAKRVLFLADRDSLVDQALTDGFKVHLPNESRTRIRTYEIDKTKRIYVSTLQTLELCYQQFSPAEFDLIITDECHRSIYNKFTDVLAYFDAVQIGLTATPAQFIDRNTFGFFECDGAMPTYLYTFDEAVKEKHLVNFNVYSAQTKFQRNGIKGIDLSEADQEALRDRGIDPDNIDYEGTEIEKNVSNRDTLRRQWEEFMDMCYKDAGGQLPGKSIIFAISHKHAMRLTETFQEMFPEHKGRLVSLIDSQMERAKDLLINFKKEDHPRIAISVDMLDTGVDLPEIVNLAFMKPVNSHIKFWQMIGRGTRNEETCKYMEWLPEGHKKEFLIIDFWENFSRFNMMPAEDEGARQIPVLVTIFNTRLNKLNLLLGEQSTDDFKRIITELRADIARIPLESFMVKRALPDVREAWEDEFWTYITAHKIEFLRMKAAPLLRYASGVNLAETFFISKMERAGLMLLQKRDIQNSIESIREDVSLLPSNIQQVAQVQSYKDAILSPKFWNEATLAKIDEAKTALSPVMKHKNPRPSLFMELDLQDIIDSKKWVILHEKEKVYVEEYRLRIEEKINELAKNHPTIQKLLKHETVETHDLLALENTLSMELGAEKIELTEEHMLKTFGIRVSSLVDFLKYMLKLEDIPTYKDVVRQAFDAFILEHNYNADQTRFLRTVQNVFIQKRSLELADLYDAPFTNFGADIVDKLFTLRDVKDLMELVKELRA
jgi:type I restriction enzyme, R subunit